jgi:hypothetical protein
MSAAGVSDLFVSQIIGYKTPGILQKYYSWFFKQRIAKPGVPFEGLYVVKNKKEGAARLVQFGVVSCRPVAHTMRTPKLATATRSEDARRQRTANRMKSLP